MNAHDASPSASPARAPFFYPIVDPDLCSARGRDPLAVALACFRGGALWLQLRDKRGGGARVLALAEAIVAAAREFRAAVIVNDRADIALMAAAAGVHVGQDDLPLPAVRAMLGPRAILGLSTHDARQVDLALGTAADYIAVGPVFGTSTKATGYDARGLDLVRYAARGGKPVVAIGGITLERAADVVAAGATAIAVISDLLIGDPEVRTRQFVDIVHV